MKYKPLKIDIKFHPIFIVGQNPGKRGFNDSPYAWDGATRTSNFVRECIQGHHNLYLSNVCNYKDLTIPHVEEGVEDLKRDIKRYMPRKIICLGAFAFDYVSKIVNPESGIKVYRLAHPSYVLRFNYGVEAFKEEIKRILNEWTRKTNTINW